MKILYYNWLQFDDKRFYGGGVNTYQKNLIEAMIKHENIQVYFLSSGKAYEKNMTHTYIRKTENIYGNNCESYEIVNSPILSSAKLSFFDTRTYLYDKELVKVFAEFIQIHGGFDVIHFNNFEGLTLGVLRTKEIFPDMKWIYTIHNYYLFCPEVQLWQHNKCNCTDFDNGRKCIQCGEYTWKWKVKKKHFYKSRSQTQKTDRKMKCLDMLDRIYSNFMEKKIRRQESGYAELFCEYRRQNILMFNRYIDVFLCVSDCVKRIALNMGLEAEKLYTEYIGTKFSDVYTERNVRSSLSDEFTIIYMGYMNQYKGFYFFLSALEQMEKEQSCKLNIIICAKNTDRTAVDRIKNLEKKFHKVVYSDGYNHDELPQLLENVQLGVVPVLWEDNLPQIAIEMTSYGVPILTSDLGGAKELSDNDLFVFKAGNTQEFIDRILYFEQHREMLKEYWKNYKRPVSLEEHIKRLLVYYEGRENE